MDIDGFLCPGVATQALRNLSLDSPDGLLPLSCA